MRGKCWVCSRQARGLGHTDNRHPIDYYLLPIMDIAAPKLLLCESNGAHLDTYQFQSLDYFAQLAARAKIEVAA